MMTQKEMIEAMLAKLQHWHDAENLVRARAKARGGIAAWLFKDSLNPVPQDETIPEVITAEWADAVVNKRVAWYLKREQDVLAKRQMSFKF